MYAMWNNFQQMDWTVCEGMGSLVRLQPKSVIDAVLIAAKQSMGNELVVSLQPYEALMSLAKKMVGGIVNFLSLCNSRLRCMGSIRVETEWARAMCNM